MKMETSASFARISKLYAALADEFALRAAEEPVTVPDRAVGLAEAAVRLGMSKSWLSRRANYVQVGGYLDQDRRVKFLTSALDAYIRTKGRA
jgi:hypothetical protein